MPVHLTISGLARAELCPASASLPQNETLRDDSDAGTEAHAQDAAEESRPGARREVAVRLNVLTGTAAELAVTGRAYPPPAHGSIDGTADAVWLESERVVVEDLKTGPGYRFTPLYAPAARNIQLGGYAVAFSLAHGKDAAQVRVREPGRADDVHDMDALDLAAMQERIRRVYERAHAPEPELVEGSHCWRCPAYSRCPAKLALGLAVAGNPQSLLADVPTLELTDEAVARGRRAVKRVKQLLGEVERVYAGYAASHPVPMGDGRVYGEHVVEREELDGAIAYDSLEAQFGPEVAKAAATFEVTKASIERALKPVAAKAGVALAPTVRGALEAMRVVGGVTKKRTVRVEEWSPKEKSTKE